MEDDDKSQTDDLKSAIYAFILLILLAIMNIKLMIFLVGVYTIISWTLYLLSIIAAPILKISEEQRIRVLDSRFISLMTKFLTFAAGLLFLMGE